MNISHHTHNPKPVVRSPSDSSMVGMIDASKVLPRKNGMPTEIYAKLKGGTTLRIRANYWAGKFYGSLKTGPLVVEAASVLYWRPAHV